MCTGKETHMRFCIDKYEYPNHEGEKPLILQSWYDADKACRSIHKRVCKNHEWTLACEGPERLPYPLEGYIRDSKACHIDERGPMIDEKRFYSAQRDEEIARIDRREASGARPGCVSPFGVYDLTGNIIDEVDHQRDGDPRPRGLWKGGNWGEWRQRLPARRIPRVHAAWFRYYQLGFRCCTEAAASADGG